MATRTKKHSHKHHAPEKSPAGEHRRAGPDAVGIAIITVSDSRSLAEDRSGALLEEIFRKAHHDVKTRVLVQDDAAAIAGAVRAAAATPAVRAIVLTGGTGIARRDVTAETIEALLDKVLPGFGELFRMLSWDEIGSAAFLSRAVAGIHGRCAVFALPGSTAACRLAATKLILPELPHLVRELDK